MESLRCGEALLRSSQPLLSFLAPTAYRSSPTIAPIARHCRPQQSQCLPSRSFTTTQCRRQQRETDGIDIPSPSSSFSSTTAPSQTTSQDAMTSLLDGPLEFDKGTPAAPASRTSRFHSPGAQARNRSSFNMASEYEQARGKANNSVDEILNNLMPTKGGSSKGRTPYLGSAEDTSYMIKGGSNRVDEFAPRAEESPPMRLGPTVGRTVNVNVQRGMDVGRAFRSLEALCGRNAVKRDSMKQRFHERPGLRRKRLKSERWRKNFKANFKGIVSMVQKMRKQGW